MPVADETDSLSSMPPVLPYATPLVRRVLGLMHRRATWVLIDQGIVSMGNFFMLGVLNRTLIPDEMGAYQVLFETILYLNGLQSALVIYPLLVRGATGNRINLGRLSTAAIFLTLALLPILGGATVASISVLHDWHISIAAVLALLLWQLQETLRRSLMADMRFADAVWGDAISYIGQAAAILLLAKIGELNLNRTFIIMAGTSAAATLLQAWQIGLQPLRLAEIKKIALDFWELGRWTLLTNASGIITSVGYSWILLLYHGKEAVAVFAAIGLCFKLANPLMSSLAGLITPAVARDSTQSLAHATRSALRYIAFGAVLLLPYFLLLLIFAGTILNYISHGRFTQYSNQLRLFVCNYTAVYFLTMISAWLGGLGHSRYNFYVSVVNIVLTLCVGLPLTAMYGVRGLVIGGLASAGLSAVSAIYFIFHLAQLSSKHRKAHSPDSL